MTRRWISALLLTALALALVRASAGLAAGQIHRSPGGVSVAREAALPAGTPHPDPRPAERSDSFCLTCHADPSLTTRAASGRIVSIYVDSRVLRDSAHSRLDCVACHRGLDRHPDEPAASGAVDMAAADVVLCESCHVAASNGYGESVHGAPVLAGTGAGATCIDCHASDGVGHATAPVADVPADRLAESVAENCGRCHESEFDWYVV